MNNSAQQSVVIDAKSESKPSPTPQSTDERFKNSKTKALVVYGLFCLGFFTGLGVSLIALIVAYVVRKSTNGTVFRGHIDMLVKTFWICLLFGIACSIIILATGLFFLSFFIAAVVTVWLAYRIIRGLICAIDNRPVWFLPRVNPA